MISVNIKILKRNVQRIELIEQGRLNSDSYRYNNKIVVKVFKIKITEFLSLSLSLSKYNCWELKN